jgi:hypothetical protein
MACGITKEGYVVNCDKGIDDYCTNDEFKEVENGKTYLILASDNRIVNAIPADKLKGSTNALIKFLNYKMLPYTDEEDAKTNLFMP